MLSERERRTFEEIERQIGGDDPRFAAAMRRLQSGGRTRLHRVLIGLAVLSGVLCVALSLPGPAFIAFGLAAVTLRLCPDRPPSRPLPRSRRRRLRRPSR